MTKGDFQNRSNKLIQKFPRNFAWDHMEEIFTKGKGKEFVQKELMNAMKRIPACYRSRQEMAKPGTLIDPIALKSYYYAIKTVNPNNVDPEMFLGSYQIEQEAKTITAKLLNYPISFNCQRRNENGVHCCFSEVVPSKSNCITESKEAQTKIFENDFYKCPKCGYDFKEDFSSMGPYIGGWFLNGGTESILQACWIFRNKYFYEKFACPKHEKILIPKFMKSRPGLFKDLFSIRRKGWFQTYPEYSRLFGRRRNIPNLKILAPINAHFSLNKAADILGFGQDNIEYYYLDQYGKPDPDEVRRVTESILNEGNDISMFWVQVGDTERGIIADTAQLDAIVSDVYDKKGYDLRPPTLVDAAAQYLFAAVMEDSEKYVDINGASKSIPIWDFRVENVKGIVTDPQKNQIPYPASILILRDPDDAKHTIMDDDKYLSLDMLSKVQAMSPEALKFTQVTATIPTSRSGYGAIATWAYYVGNGIAEIRRRKEEIIWKNVLTLWHELVNGELCGTYELICEPESASVCFRISPDWVSEHLHELEKNRKIWIDDERFFDMYRDRLEMTPNLNEMIAGKATYHIYEKINGSTSHMLYISKSETLLARTRDEYISRNNIFFELNYLNDDLEKEGKSKISEKSWEYFGINIHIMEHNTEKAIRILIKYLLKEAMDLLSE